MNLSTPSTTNTCRPRILIESYECSPVRNHVPGSAWQIISRLSQWFDIWVITEQIQYKKEIEDYLASRPNEAQFLHFRYIPRGKKEGFGRQRPPLPLREILDYRRWLKKSYNLAVQLDKEVVFDLVHHLRTNTFREPGWLWKLGKPSIWGPVGGTYCVPKCLLSFLDPVNHLRYAIRNRINEFQFSRSHKVRQAFKAAAVILAQTSTDIQRIKQVHHRNAVLCNEQGMGQAEDTLHSWDGRRPLRMVWVARCIAGKALSILLQAMEGLKESRQVELHVVGDGVELNRWKQQAIRRNVNHLCVWHGWQTPQQTHAIMDQADIIAFTSLLEGTTATIMESFARGLPVIALKHCGFEDVINSDCGILIPCKEKHQIAADFQKAISDLLANPHRILLMSRAVINRRQCYTWDSIVEKIRDVYYRTLNISHLHDTLDSSDLQYCMTGRPVKTGNEEF